MRPWLLALLLSGIWLSGFGAMAEETSASRLSRAAHQLAGAQTASGLLQFDFDFLKGRPGDNDRTKITQTAYIVRQGSAALALAKYYRATRDASVRDALVRLIAGLGKSGVRIGRPALLPWLDATGLLSTSVGRLTLTALLDRLGLLYRPTGSGRLLAYHDDIETAWAGGSAVALLAELFYAEASGDQQFKALRLGWRDGLLALRRRDGGFRIYPRSLDETPYANGEAWLALAELAAHGDQTATAALRQIEPPLIARNTAKPEWHFFGWSAMAARTRYLTTHDPRYLRFIAGQAENLLASQPLKDSDDENSCAEVEGLAAATMALAAGGQRQSDLYQRLQRRIDVEMARNNALQIAPDQQRIDLSGGAALTSPRLADFAGAYLAGTAQPFVRVDITAHCISALVELMSEAAGEAAPAGARPATSKKP